MNSKDKFIDKAKLLINKLIDDKVYFDKLIKLIDNLNFIRMDRIPFNIKELGLILDYDIPKDSVFFKLVDDTFGVKKSLYLIINGFSYSWGLFDVEFDSLPLKNGLVNKDYCLFFDDYLNSLYDALTNSGFDFAKYVLKKKISELV
jgi:hypothetical protein